MQSYRTHDKGGTTPATKPVITILGYNFAGEKINEKVLYQIDGLSNTETLATYEYDNTGRQTKVSHGINTAVSEVSRSAYDEAGRLKQSKIRATGTYTTNGTPISGLQTIDYAYHLRGQLQGINLDGSGNPVPDASQGDLFSYKLDYETAGFYNGNIGKQYWQASANNAPVGIRTYTFTYDAASRLTSADYTGNGTEDYDLPTVGYDRNGNITSLQRNGKLTSTFGLMDNLTYTYAGNRLMRVEDAVTGDYEVDFVNRNSGSDDYSYHANGALKSDNNEAITDIIYSTYASQPVELQLSGSRWIKNLYDGVGRLYKTSYSTGEYWEYLDGLVFKNGALYQLSTPEGRAVYESGDWTYEYFQTDHLGNTRVAYKANGTALTKTSETSFDPWGVVLREAGLVNSFQNKFEFLNREKESTFNLNLIRLGARGYNPTIGRFDRIDPVVAEQEQYSTYLYGWNNPVLRSDPNGNCPCILPALPFLPEIAAGVGVAFEFIAGTTVGAAIGAGIKKLVGSGAGEGVGAYNPALGVAMSTSKPGELTGGARVVNSSSNNSSSRNPSVQNEGSSSTSGATSNSNSGQGQNPNAGKRRQNRIPDKGTPNSTETNQSGTTIKKYGPDGNVQKEFNKGHQGNKVTKNEQNDHVHDYKHKPNLHPNDPQPTERQPGRPPKKGELKKDFEL